MSFDEFLDATGNSSLIRVKKEASPEHPLMDAFYNKLVEAFRSFILVGGMPEAVSILILKTYDKAGKGNYNPLLPKMALKYNYFYLLCQIQPNLAHFCLVCNTGTDIALCLVKFGSPDGVKALERPKN